MNVISGYFLEVGITLLMALLITRHLRPHLKRILVDLCRTEERAQFWTLFCGILLVGFPLAFAMGYSPQAASAQRFFFEVAGQLRWNLLGFLFALIGIGFVVGFFALVAPRPEQQAGRERQV